MTVALRFGSDSYAKGGKAKAKAAFTEALDLFTVIGLLPNKLCVINLFLFLTDTAEQIALFNLTSLYLAQKVNTLEAHYLEALCQPKAMHTATVTKILVALGNFLLEKRPADAPMLESIAMHHGFNLSEMYGGGASKPKKVAFAIDYSGRFRALVVTTTSSYI